MADQGSAFNLNEFMTKLPLRFTLLLMVLLKLLVSPSWANWRLKFELLWNELLGLCDKLTFLPNFYFGLLDPELLRFFYLKAASAAV